MTEFTYEYGVVTNSLRTYTAAAERIRGQGYVLMGWTDNAMSHMDVLLAIAEPFSSVGPLNRIDNHTLRLLVGVAGRGMFGFAIRADNFVHHVYLAEKLGFGPSATTEALAELVNGIIADFATVSL